MENNQGKSKKLLIALFVLIIVFILLLSAAIGLALFGDSLGIHVFGTAETTAPTTEEVTTVAVTTAEPTTAEPEWEVPDVVGMSANDAYAALNHAGTRFEIRREYSEEVETDHVISQFPEPGTMIKDSEKVAVIISKGTDQPDTTAPSTTKSKSSSSSSSSSSGKSSSGSSGDYILSGSDSRYISKLELTFMSKDKLTLALNEIYARHGRKFDTPSIQAYFNSKSWYHGTISPSDFDESSLNEYEDANVQTIVSVMRSRGFR